MLAGEPFAGNRTGASETNAALGSGKSARDDSGKIADERGLRAMIP